MSLSKLSDSIIQRSEKKAHEIVEEAKHTVEGAKRKEHKRSIEKKVKADEDIKRAIEQYKKEKMLWAHLEGKRIISEAKNDVVESSLSRFRDIVGKMRKTSKYKLFMKNAVLEAINELSSIKSRKSMKFIAHILKGEKRLIPRVKGLVVKEDLPKDTLGGVIVEFNDGSIRVNMTLLEVLNIKSTEIRGKIYNKLFGKEHGSKR